MRYLIVVFTLLATALSAQAQYPDAPQVAAPSNQDANWRPTDAQMLRVKQDAAAYFTARDSGQYPTAYLMFAPSNKAATPYETWKQHAEEANQKSGGFSNRSIRKISWYKDPQGRTGTLAALDFYSEAPNLVLHCGFIVMEAQAEGNFLLVREEDNFIDKASAAKFKPGDMERIRAAYRC